MALGTSPTKSTEQIVPMRYFSIKISECENFIILQSINDIYLFDTDLKLITYDASAPVYSIVFNYFWKLCYVNKLGLFSTKTIQIERKIDASPKGQAVQKFRRKLGYEAMSTFNLGFSLIKEFFKTGEDGPVRIQPNRDLMRSILE